MTRRSETAVILLAATLGTLPLLLSGPSCGHDLPFHLLNWMDAAHQWRLGTLRPWWTAAAAWHTGEPRFLFYPPLSWILGALLTLLTGPNHAPAAFTAIALALSGLTMRRFLATYVSPPLALLGACLYLAHPYMLFTATERTAYAELLAAAWLPWLLQEVLRAQEHTTSFASHNPFISTGAGQLHRPAQRRNPHLPGSSNDLQPLRLALPIALLWLTNTPAAVLGTYTLALVLAVRATLATRNRQPILKPLLLPTAKAYALGLAFAAWYLLPALAQHSAVEVAQAFTAGMQPEEATLFAHTGQPYHDHVVAQASWLAVGLLLAAALAAAVHLARRANIQTHHGMRDAARATHQAHARNRLYPTLLTLTAAVLFLLTPASLFLWHHAPELHFLQFPWRTLMLQGVLTTTLIVFAVRANLTARLAVHIALVAVAALSVTAHHSYAQTCDDEDAPPHLAAQYATGGGFELYDEYTPRDADNDLLRPDLPPAWTAPAATAPAPATEPTGILTLDTGRTNEQTLQLHSTPEDRFVIVRQRRFQNWHVLLDGQEVPTEVLRDDDLLALPLPTPGAHTVTLQYRWSWDQYLGAIVSATAVLTLLVFRRT